MYDYIWKLLEKREKPIDVIVSGLGFMGFGFISAVRNIPGLRVPLLISRRPKDSKKFLEERGLKVKIENNSKKIKEFADKGLVCVSDDLDLIELFESEAVLEMTGTIAYGTEVAIRAIKSRKHFITMNPELQEAVGSELKKLANLYGVVISDVIGDQPGSLARLISLSKMQGFKVLVAGNMKRYLDRHATQIKMQPWADDKGLNVRQTVSFTDGTKQSIEMSLVANYFGMDILQFGMKGPQIEDIKEVLDKFNWNEISEKGIVDYAIGMKLFPGIFLVVEHKDPHQTKYLRYLGLGDGPRYVLFEPYHLCHLDVAGTIAKVVLFRQETINNGLEPIAKTIAVAKFDLKKGQTLDGIGGNLVYGNIDKIGSSDGFLQIGLSEGAILKNDIHQDQPIKLEDVELPDNVATRLLGLVTGEKRIKNEDKVCRFPLLKMLHILE